MLSMFLASMEGTVVATAMPTIVAQLGGLEIYSWVFSVYLLASTTTVPIYGKLSDLLGRKRVYAASMGLFLLGSVLCGSAGSMEQLIFFRAIQGLGAGGVLPLAFTIIGELFSLEQRARMQGLFSGVWGVSAVIGPLIGGFLVDQISWHWVFLINIIPGLLAGGIVWFAWRDAARKPSDRVSVDYLGAGFLMAGVLCLMLGLNDLGSPRAWVFLAASLALFAALVRVERRVADPILPFTLFRSRVFTVSIVHGLLAGWAVFGSINYVPLFVQAVLGTSATQAGISLTPMSLAWTLASILGSRLLLKVSYRALSLFGMLMVTAGALCMARINMHATQFQVMLYTGLMGVGMGFSIPAFLIAVQSSVRREALGVATSTIQFSRSIGSTLGVSILGVFLGTRLASHLVSSGIDPNSVSLNTLLDPLAGASAAFNGPLREALAISIANLFLMALIVAVLGLLAVLFAPGGRLTQLRPEGAVQDGEAHE